MIQQYTTGEGVKENELWIRRQALLVMLYEGICMQVFDYDCTPHPPPCRHLDPLRSGCMQLERIAAASSAFVSHLATPSVALQMHR